MDSSTIFIQQSCSCEVDSSLAGHKIHHLVWNPKVHPQFKNSHPDRAEFSSHNNMLYLKDISNRINPLQSKNTQPSHSSGRSN